MAEENVHKESVVEESLARVTRIVTRYIAKRRKLPVRRRGDTQRFCINGQTFFMRSGEYEDGSLGEIFIDIAKAGSEIRYLYNMLAITASIGLQYGALLSEYVEAWMGTRSDPHGKVSGNKHVKFATSILDAIARDLAVHYGGQENLSQEQRTEVEVETAAHVDGVLEPATDPGQEAVAKGYLHTACVECGCYTLKRNGPCDVCETCGRPGSCS